VSLFANIFTNNILPAFLVMACGFILDRKLQVDKKSLSRVAIYILTPCLVFSAIVQSTVDPRDFGLMIVFVAVITILMTLLAIIVGRALRWSPRMIDALVLSVAFLNAGNFGLSIILFAYGEAGLELGTVFFVATNFAGNTLAAFFASRGNGNTRQALGNVFRLPGIYAFILALILRIYQVPMPAIIMNPVSLIGRAAVPVMLMMLGLQLSQTPVSKRYKEIGVGVFLRLVVSAVLAIILAPLMGLAGLARQVAIVQSGTPAAVTSALMAIEFDADAEYVTSAIFFSTLFSGVTLTILIYFVGA
jgi:predicted permease